VAEELRLATLCINYLNLPSFTDPCSEQAVLAGEYGFMEYAILYWLRHLEAGLTSSPSDHDDLLEELAESLEVLVERHWNNPAAEIGSISNRTRDMLETFSGCQSYLRIQLAVVLTDKELRHFGDTRPEQSALNFAGIVSAVRYCLETIVDDRTDASTDEDLELKYGVHLFKCPRFSCKYFTEGFSTSDEREKHVERHERPARCTDEHCRGSKIGFATKAQLERHLKENHPDLTERSHNFPTDEEISESVRENLPEPEPEVEPEPENLPDTEIAQPLPVAGPAVDSALAEAAPQAARPRETAKRRKLKQDYECIHCGKKFTKKFNWQSHLASHSADQRYPCPHCSQTCARPGDLNRHLKLHDPDSAVTCGGILANGQRWGCGTSFARADILRSHHKSKKGRRCIAQRDAEEQAGPSNS
jgi:DNA-directed RNA polymerase subunit RPC12/RpoP